jgi:hypothetical protein
MNPYLALILIIFLYGVAIFFIIRTFVIAFSFKKGEVPYVPISKSEMMSAILALDLIKSDNFIDIGSGDGRVVMAVSKLYPDIQCTGIERNKLLVIWSRFVAMIFGRKNVQFDVADALKHDYSQFNKVFMYLTLDLIVPLVTKFDFMLGSDAKVVSCKFGFGGLINKGDFKDIGEGGTQLWTKK